MQSSVVAFAFSIIVVSVQGARILGIVHVPSHSHQVAFRPIWKELSRRGHQVTLITTDPMKDANLTNLKEIDISVSYDILRKHKYHEKIFEFGNNAIKMMKMMMEAGAEIDDTVLSLDEIQNLLHNKSVEFDLVMVEFWNPVFFAFSHRFRAPFIGISSLDTSFMGHDCLGNPTHPVLNPDGLLPFQTDLTFIQRVISTLYSVAMRYFTSELAGRIDGQIEKYFGGGYPSVGELACSVDLMLLNINLAINKVRPIVPATIIMGGGMHILETNPLPKDLQEYLDDAKEGVIYFSLGGTNVQSKMIPQKLKDTVMAAFAELPYKVLWKFEEDQLPGKPDNVKIAKWLPQQDLLRHPNVKLFITQGGIQSLEEAIFSHVPMVGMPFFGDQQNNIQKMVHKGLGLSVDKDNLDKESFKATILEVINNSKYRERVKEIAELSLDQPMTGLEKAVWWTEYVIRHKGAQHLKGPAAKLPLYQYFLLDVIGFCVAVLLVVTYITVKLVKVSYKLLRRVCCRCCKSKVKTN